VIALVLETRLGARRGRARFLIFLDGFVRGSLRSIRVSSVFEQRIRCASETDLGFRYVACEIRRLSPNRINGFTDSFVSIGKLFEVVDRLLDENSRMSEILRAAEKLRRVTADGRHHVSGHDQLPFVSSAPLS